MTVNRLDDLEIKVAFLEHHLSQLDELLRETSDRLELLGRSVGRLEDRIASVSESLRDAPGHEPPPHHLPDPIDGQR